MWQALEGKSGNNRTAFFVASDETSASASFYHASTNIQKTVCLMRDVI